MTVRLLATMPNGEAFRADTVKAVRIAEEAGLLGAERRRYAVMVHLDEGEPSEVGHNLAWPDAVNLARQVGRLVNDALAQHALANGEPHDRQNARKDR
ncbi:MAG: hypothetical protein ACFB6S_07170 [Geminicoccaceae bacterium]